MNMDFREVKQSILIRVSSHHHRMILLSLDNIWARSKNFSRVTNVFCPWESWKVAVQSRQFVLAFTLIVKVGYSCRGREQTRCWFFTICQTSSHYLIVVLVESWWIENFYLWWVWLQCTNVHNCLFTSVRNFNLLLLRSIRRYFVKFLEFLHGFQIISLSQ
jgi:hypothetical protein